MIRKQSPEEQIATMQRLINFGVNENKTQSSKPVLEFKKKAANGKTYGIIRESTKYYLMEAPQKDTEVLAEDFDYIGGFNNRKEHEYTSYSKASNALDLTLMSINESVNKEKRVIVETPTVKAEWEDKITESMRKEIDRFKTITENVAKILKEDKGAGEVPSAHTLLEAPATHPSDEKVNAPFTQSGVANGEKDFKKEEHNHETAGTPYDKEGKSSIEKNMQSDKKPVIKTDAEYLTKENTYEPDNNVASEKPSGGKVVKVNESKGKKIRLKLTEEQVLAWNDNKNYIDTSNGTEIGSSAPFTDELGKESNQTEAPTEPIHEQAPVVHNTDTQNVPSPTGTNDVETEDGDPFVKSVNEDVTSDEAAGFEDEEDFSDYPFPEVEGDDVEIDDEEDLDEPEFEIDMDDDSEAWKQAKNNEDEFTVDRANKDIADLLNHDYDDEYSDYPYESAKRHGKRLAEEKLNVFGKHPAWRKQPMTTPPNKEVAINGAREWDDESVQGEQPYAEKIGDSAPFDEVVDSVFESVMNRLYGNKKKV